MSPSPRLIFEQPNIENTIPLAVYQASSPEKFSIEDDDKFVLHAGGAEYKLSILNNDPTSTINISSEIEGIQDGTISLFVLNTSFIIWIDSLEKGLELPYQCISLSALQELNDTQVLYLQILSNDYIHSISSEPSENVLTVELVVSKALGTGGRTNPLFKNTISDIHGTYDALSTCSAFHFDSASDEESYNNGNELFSMGEYGASSDMAPSLEIPSSWIGDEGLEGAAFKNVGDADDLEIDDDEIQKANDNGAPVAGMNVDVGFASILGSTRKRGEDEMSESIKARKLT